MEIDFFFRNSLYVGYLSLAISVIIGLVRLKKLNGDQQLLLILIGLVILVEISSRILWYLSTNNLFLYHFYAVIEFLLLATLYNKHIHRLIKPMYMFIIMTSFVLFAIINTAFFQSLKQFNSHVTFVECILLIVFAILYFYKELRDLENRHLERIPMFWINASVITYFSGSLVLFYVANDLIPESMKVKGVVWGTHALFNIVHYALYAVALLVKNQEETTKQANSSESF